MKSKKITTLFLILLCCFSIHSGQLEENYIQKKEPESAHNPYLIIYVTRNFAEKMSYEFIQAFAREFGLIPQLIAMIEFENTNRMLNELILERNDPIADVVIGLDQFSLELIKEKELLIPYQSPELVNISSDLMDYLDPNYFLTPYAYSLSGFRVNPKNLDEIQTLNENNFTLDYVGNTALTSNLIIENPTMTSLGMEFLLQTIAIYGDPYVNFTGLLNSDWREWWISNKGSLEIFNDENDALLEWNNPNGNRSLIFSHNSDYGDFENYENDSSSNFFFFQDKNQMNSWLHVEGIGLINDDPVPSIGKTFIDWILSTEFQNNISKDLEMYPANNNATISPEFSKNHKNLLEINILNDLIEPSLLKSNINFWKDEWEELFSEGFDLAVIPGFDFKFFAIFIIGGIYINIEFLRRRKK